MGIIRNLIDIVGITAEDQLPEVVKGQVIEYSETENIYLGKDNMDIKNIYQIIISIDLKSNRVINGPLNRIVVLDGIKNIKMTYYDNENKASVLEVKSPFNCFIDLDKEVEEIEDFKIYIADAYFELVNNNILYSHMLYIVDVHYCNGKRKNFNNRMFKSVDLNNNVCTILDREAIEEISVSQDLFKNKKDYYQEEVINENNELMDLESEYL